MLVDIHGVHVDFPFEPYEPQRNYMSQVIEALENGQNAVLESPTGTGKTLSLLCSALAWQECQKERQVQQAETGRLNLNAVSNRVPTIIYASRTHTQLSQVVNELKNSRYKPKITILSSRHNMCVNPEVSSRPQSEIRSSCRALTKGNNCKYKRNVDIYGRESSYNIKSENVIMDIEELRIHSEQRGVCPYFLSRSSEVQQAVDLVFMPYNYLVDESVRSGLDVVWNNAIVIIDEAHNLESVCDEAASFTLSNGDLSKAVNEIDECLDMIEGGHATGESLETNDLVVLKKVFLDLEGLIDEVVLRKTQIGVGAQKPGDFFVDMLDKAFINEKTIVDFKAYLRKAIDFRTKASALEKFDKALERVYPAYLLVDVDQNPKKAFNIKLKPKTPFQKVKERANQFFRCYIAESETNSTSYNQTQQNRNSFFRGGFGDQTVVDEGRKVNFWCFCPGVALSSLKANGVHSVILTSGTLSPLSSFASQMSVPFPVRLENPHVIRDSQVWVGVVKTGPTKKKLNSSYRNRDTDEYKSELGNTICNFSRIIPDGVLVFFPSYGVMNNCIKYWDDNGITARIKRFKTPVQEARNATDMVKRVEEYNDMIGKGKGAIFYAVCRGKASEGIDFANRRCRAVIITGLPYPPSMDPKVYLKRSYLDQQAIRNKNPGESLKGDEWYGQQASRAVNQAVGRVIRHKLDFGAVILCDERFGSQKGSLSAWLRNSWHVTKGFGDTNKELINFFKKCLNDPELQKASAKEVLSGNASTSATTGTSHRIYNSKAFSSEWSNGNENDVKKSIFGMGDKSKANLGNLLGKGKSSSNLYSKKSRVDISYDYDNEHVSQGSKQHNTDQKSAKRMDRYEMGTNAGTKYKQKKKSLDAGMRDLYANASPLAPRPNTKMSMDMPKMSNLKNVTASASLKSKSRKSLSGANSVLAELKTNTQVSSKAKPATTSEYLRQKRKNALLMSAVTRQAPKPESKGEPKRQKKDTKGFLESCKSTLSSKEYQQFKKELRDLKTNISDDGQVAECISKIGELFSGERVNLRKGLYPFLPKEVRPLYKQLLFKS